MIIVAGHFEVPAEKRDSFIEAAKLVAAETLKEAGCVYYEFWQDLESGTGRYSLLEAWETQEQLRAHLKAPHIAEFDGKEPGMTNVDISAYEIARTLVL